MKYEVVEIEVEYPGPVDLPEGSILIRCKYNYRQDEYAKGQPITRYWDLHYLKPVMEDSG